RPIRAESHACYAANIRLQSSREFAALHVPQPHTSPIQRIIAARGEQEPIRAEGNRVSVNKISSMPQIYFERSALHVPQPDGIALIIIIAGTGGSQQLAIRAESKTGQLDSRIGVLQIGSDLASLEIPDTQDTTLS